MSGSGLEVGHLEVHIARLPVLRDVDLEVRPGSIAGLVGRNGAGKTTTLRSIMGLLRVRRGTITFDGVDLVHTPAHHRTRLGIGYMPEDRRLIPALSVEENVLLPAWAGRDPEPGPRLARVYQQISEVRAFAGRRATQLSGGQQKLVALARALVAGRRLLLLDEPFEGLAPALADRMAEAIATAREEGRAVLLADSEPRRVERLADRIYTIERGEAHAEAGLDGTDESR
ncbi:MAG: ABC transporter ATP-binding protein [Acidimicrobiales bacterium]